MSDNKIAPFANTCTPRRKSLRGPMGHIHVQIDANLHREYDDYCAKRRLIRGAFVEDAIRCYLEYRKNVDRLSGEIVNNSSSEASNG